MEKFSKKTHIYNLFMPGVNYCDAGPVKVCKQYVNKAIWVDQACCRYCAMPCSHNHSNRHPSLTANDSLRQSEQPTMITKILANDDHFRTSDYSLNSIQAQYGRGNPLSTISASRNKRDVMELKKTETPSNKIVKPEQFKEKKQHIQSLEDPKLAEAVSSKAVSVAPKFGGHRKPNEFYRCKITAAFNPCNFYIQTDDDEFAQFNLMRDKLQLEFDSKTKTELNREIATLPSPGSMYAALYNGLWQRVIVERRVQQGKITKASIFFVDIGRRSIQGFEKLYNLPKEYMELPAQAVYCKLKSCFPSYRAQSNSSFVYFRSPEAESLMRSAENKSAVAFVTHLNPGFVGDLPNKRETTLFVILYFHYNATSLNQQYEDLFFKSSKSITSFDTPARLKITNALLESAIEEPVESRAKSPSGDSFYSAREGSIVGRDTSQDKAKGCVLPLQNRVDRDFPVAKSWKQMDGADIWKTSFIGIVTWVDIRGGIYIHNKQWSKQLLAIRGALNTIYNNSTVARSDVDCEPGDPCVAKYEKNWYRATIQRVNEREKLVTVKLIDYGWLLDVSCLDVCKDIVFEEVSVQTLRCELFNFRPASVNLLHNNWPEAMVDHLLEIAVDQEFDVEVVSVCPLQVELSFTKNGVQLVDFLVASRKGEYLKKKTMRIARK